VLNRLKRLRSWNKKRPFLALGAFNQQQSCKPGSVFRLSGTSIINLVLPLPTAFNNLPILKFRCRSGSEQLRVQDLFGFSTPEVYRDPGRPEKP